MQELRLVAVSEDGSYAVLVVPGRSGRFALPIDERLRTVARGQFSRLAQYEIEVESPLRPKEIQDRIRAGETAEEIADAAGLPVDRIRRFEGPVLAEREFRAKEARLATVRGGEAGPGPRLGEIVTHRLADLGASAEEAEWDSRKRHDGNWQVQLAYTLGGRLHLAEWVYDPRSRHVTPDDDEAIRLCLAESQWPEPRQAPRSAATATVTPIGSRASAGAHPPNQPHPSDARTQPDVPNGLGALHPSRRAPADAGRQAGTQAPDGGRAAGRQAGGATGVTAGAERGSRPAREEPEPLVAKATRENGREPAAVADGDVTLGAGQPGANPAGARPAVGEAAPAAGRQARRASGGRSRRSSVPSWDEIMFGNSRQPD